MSEHVKINDVVRFSAFTFHPSGGALTTADETPRWSVFEEASDTPILEGAFSARTGFIGTYRGTFDATLANGFNTQSYYEVHASGKVQGVVGRIIVKSFVLDDIFNANVLQVESGYVTAVDITGFPSAADISTEVWANEPNVYFADLKYTKDISGINDEYTVVWLKDTTILSSGNISNPAISVYKTNDSTALFENQTMDFIGTQGILRYNETTPANIQNSGEPYLFVASGTIDSSTRVWKKLVGIDLLY